MNKTDFTKRKIFFLILFLTIGIIIIIPISTAWVFTDIFPLNYTKTSNCELGEGGTNSADNCDSGVTRFNSTPKVELKTTEEVNEGQDIGNASSMDIIPIPQQDDAFHQVINEDIVEETLEIKTEIITEIKTEIKTEKIITGPYSINLISSGLVLSDPLNDVEIKDYWIFGGNAESIHAPYDHLIDSEGMHIGVQAPKRGVYAGHSAEVPPTNGTLFHSKITTPKSYIPNGYLQNGLYVQSSSGAPNFVTCIVITSASGKLTWAVTHTSFDVNGISKYKVLWSDVNPKPSLTRECTIITNGNDVLRVILDTTEVYSNYKSDLQMNSPFSSYLETQSSHAEEKLYGTYQDFYITSGATIQVTNVPNYIVQMTLTDMSNNILATGNVINGTGIIDVANFHFPFIANIHAIQNQRPVISTSSPVTIFGGDVYSVVQSEP